MELFLLWTAITTWAFIDDKANDYVPEKPIKLMHVNGEELSRHANLDECTEVNKLKVEPAYCFGRSRSE